jgi:glycosyltransferase-like protein
MKDKLRVALFTYSTKPRGGVIHTLALAEHLQALGHEVHVFALGKDQTGFFRPLTVAYSLIPVGELPEDIALDVRINRYIEAYYAYLMADPSPPFDIYHVQDCISANGVWRVREAGRFPSFARTIHHVDDFINPRLIQCQNDSIHRPNHCLVVSRYWQGRLKDEFGVEAEVIHNGVDLDRYRPPRPAQRAAARRQWGLTDEFAFLNIGGIEPRKNTIRLFQAYRRVKDQLDRRGRRSVLLLAGGETILDYTSYRQEFFDRLDKSELQVDQDVRLLGNIPDEDMASLYHAADVLAFPSVKEGWGLVVLEAMASRLAVLASDSPVFREYLRPGENAMLVEPLDEEAIAKGLLRLAKDRVYRERLAQAGPGTAQKFSWEDTARAHEARYRQWLAEEGRG